MDPSSHVLTAAPLSASCPVLAGAAQTSRFEQERWPAGHHADAGQLAASRRLGAAAQGAANQVRLLGGSAATLGGQAWSEQGGDPNWQAPTQFAPPPTTQVPDEIPVWLTNSRVTSRASMTPPLRQIPPPPANPEPLK